MGIVVGIPFRPPRWAFIACWLLTSAATAQSLYVSDELVITVRTGPSTGNAIVTNLRSGDMVEVLEVDPDSGYSRVRASDGSEGWALSRFLTEQAIARDQLADNQSELAEARDRLAELEQQVATLSEELDSTSERLEDADAANASMNAELVNIRNVSANSLTLRDSNTNLRRSLNERDQQLEALALENRAMRNSAIREWFVVGAGVLLGGIVIGLILPSLRRKRRSEW